MNTSTAAARCALYARISEDATGEGIGVRRQLLACRELAEARGWDVVAESTDNDVSALKGVRRPGYQQVLELVREGAIDYVVVWQTSRLLRNRRERAEAIELFGRQRVGIITVKGQDLDLSTAYGRGMAGMLGEFDTMESEVKSERVAAAAAQRARDGRPSGTLGYGWQKNGEGAAAVYVENPLEAEVVRECTRRLLSGESLLAVTRDLNERGVPAPASPSWGKTSVKKLVLRAANAGLRVHHRGRATEALYEGAWPPLVDRGEWERVCSLLNDPARRVNGVTRPGARRHLLTGGVGLCGVCGGVLRVGTKGNASYGTKKQLYLCADRGCVGRDEAAVDNLVRGVVAARMARPDALDWTRTDDEETQRLGAHLSGIRRRLDDAADSFAEGLIDARQLERITSRLAPEHKAAAAAYAASSQAFDPAVMERLAGPSAGKQWDEMSIAQRRVVLEVLGVKVTVNRVTKRGPGFDPGSVRIDWKAMP